MAGSFLLPRLLLIPTNYELMAYKRKCSPPPTKKVKDKTTDHMECINSVTIARDEFPLRPTCYPQSNLSIWFQQFYEAQFCQITVMWCHLNSHHLTFTFCLNHKIGSSAQWVFGIVKMGLQFGNLYIKALCCAISSHSLCTQILGVLLHDYVSLSVCVNYSLNQKS